MKLSLALVAAVAALSVSSSPPTSVLAADAPQDPAALEFFERKIRPLLAENCFNCHSASNKSAGGLRVDDRNGLLSGGNRGAAVVPSDPEKSIILRAVKQTDGKLKMPPGGKLSDEQIADLERWIHDGAVWPKIVVPEEILAAKPEYEQLKREHWSWQPLQKPEVPQVKRPDWAKDDVDRFVLAKLEAEGLSPVVDSEKNALLRRVTFDLTGLPPTPAELDEFIKDDSSQAFEKAVDRLLASTAFGEKWGRHWLDLARYGESTGSARNLPYPQAWRYRDYVIDAINKDKPYDQFIREQIAGDLLPFETEAQREEQLIATGFLALGVKDVNQRFKVRFIMDNIDEQIDTVTRSVLGLTVSCARCHDHKFDPIPTREYYGLAGIFQSTDLCAGLRNQMGGAGLAYYDTKLLLVLSKIGETEVANDDKIEAARKAADDAKEEFETLRGTPAGAELAPNGRPRQQVARQKWNRLQAEFVALTDVTKTHKIALGVRDAKIIGDTEIRIRGEAEKLGPVAPRGFLSVVNIPNEPTIPAGQSGRLQLAQWLTAAENPLASRVIVNRVWKNLFGAGLVRTVDNFGVTGDKPSHPELLDHLAQRVIENGWSIKKLVRSLVLTRTYQLSSESTDEHLVLDPDNRLHWRHNPRRLTAEELRDSALVVAGRLNSTRPAGSPANDLRVIELRNNGPEAQRIVEAGRFSEARSIYLPLLRTLVPTSLEVFDFAEQGLVTGQRDTTTVPTQALYLLNDSFVRRQSLLAAAKLLESPSSEGDDVRINRLYEISYGRAASSGEIARAKYFLADFEAQASKELADVFAQAAAQKASTDKAAADAAKAADEAKKANAASTLVLNADDVDQTDVPIKELDAKAPDARTAAWASLVQALIGSGEFRYLK